MSATGVVHYLPRVKEAFIKEGSTNLRDGHKQKERKYAQLTIHLKACVPLLAEKSTVVAFPGSNNNVENTLNETDVCLSKVL